MILGFSTAGPFCGAALFADGQVLASRHEALAKGQAERLMGMLDDVLADAGASFSDVSALGVGAGPGNFTGIRISVAAARGLALALNVPAVAVSALEALALDLDGPVLSSVSAGREGFYLARFGAGVARPAAVVAEADVESWRCDGLTCVGEKAEELAGMLGADAVPAQYDPAVAIARIAAQRWSSTTTRPAPIYLRAPDAAPARDTAPKILP